MKLMKLGNTVLMFAVTAACPVAHADQPDQTSAQQPTQSAPKNAQTPQANRSDQKTRSTNNSTDQAQSTSMDKSKSTDRSNARADNEATRPKLDSEQVMKLSQQAMTHIAAAEKALDQNKKAAAKAALAKSQQSLSKLYNTPALLAMLNEFDEAINALSGEKPVVEPLDLAPLAASVSTYQAYLDPDVAAGVKQAQERAREGDKQGAQDALRLARNRVAVDVAFLPVEEAYTRVLAAQQALDNNNMKEAKRLLRNVPVVISQVQISRPLVPIRFKLQAAAEAADAQNWSRARTLLKEANRDVQHLESIAGTTDLKSELTPIANQLKTLSQQAQAGQQVEASQIRELAQRTRTLGEQQDMEKQG